jgi:structural maintenance of chromosome 4
MLIFSLKSVKDEAEAYMLKELLSLQWQEKATNLASDNAGKQVVQLQQNVDNMEATRNIER